MSRQNLLPAISRHQNADQAVAPTVPLNFVHPGLTLSQVFSIIMGYRKIGLIVVAISLVVTVVLLKVLPRTYTATATLMLNYELNDTLNGKALPMTQIGSYIATQLELLRNKELLSEVTDKLHLGTMEEYAAGYKGKTGTLTQWVSDKINKNLRINQGNMGGQLIYVSFSAHSPYLAAGVANAIVETYKAQDDKRAISAPVELISRYALQLDDLKRNVEIAQQKVTDFRNKHDLLDEGKVNIDVGLFSNLENRLLAAQNDLRAAQINALGDPTLTKTVSDSSDVRTLKAKLSDQELKLSQMVLRYTPDHPELVDLKSSIKATKKALDDAIQENSVNARVKNREDLRAARRMVARLEAAVAKQRVKVLANGKLQDETAKYILALKSAQDAYKRALDDFDKLKFSSTLRKSNIHIISKALPPMTYSKPKILKGILMGVVMGFMLGFGVPLAYELINRRVRCRDDFERDHGITVLAEFGEPSMRAIR